MEEKLFDNADFSARKDDKKPEREKAVKQKTKNDRTKKDPAKKDPDKKEKDKKEKKKPEKAKRKKDSDRVFLNASIIGFFITSFSFLVMPMDGYLKFVTANIITIVSGALFWFGLVLGFVSLIVLSSRMKKWCVSHHIDPGKNKIKKIGLINFFKSKTASVFDILTIISLIAMIIFFIVNQYSIINYALCAVFTFSLAMHSILNGKLYTFVCNKRRVLKKLEEEKNKSDKGDLQL